MKIHEEIIFLYKFRKSYVYIGWKWYSKASTNQSPRTKKITWCLFKFMRIRANSNSNFCFCLTPLMSMVLCPWSYIHGPMSMVLCPWSYVHGHMRWNFDFLFFSPPICAKQFERFPLFPKKPILTILDDKLDPFEWGQGRKQVHHDERHGKR